MDDEYDGSMVSQSSIRPGDDSDKLADHYTNEWNQ